MTLPTDPGLTGDYQRGWVDGHGSWIRHHETQPTALFYILLASVFIAGLIAGAVLFR